MTGDATAAVTEVLRSLVEPGEPVALVNFADHANVGDAAIWLGQLAVLDRLGCPVRYQCASWGYDAGALRRRHPDGPILINGGGNFGDLYPQQRTRMAVLADFGDRRIVQLPQSIHFDDPANAEVTATAWRAHPDVHLLVREGASAATAAALGLESITCPDMALALPGPTPVPEPRVPVLWLRRQDGEAVAADVRVPDGVEVVDWLGPFPGELPWPVGARLARRVTEAARRGRPVPQPVLVRAFESKARYWTDRGLALLGRGRVVVTDRLHGHLLATRMGIPNVATDNRTGKVRAVYEGWTAASPLTHWADDPGTALDLALELA